MAIGKTSLMLLSINKHKYVQLWRCHDIEQYQLELDKMLQDSYPTLDMFLDHSESKLCLKKEYVSKFHDVIINAAHNAMDKHIPHTGDRKPKVIPGWDIEMDCARQSSLF